MTSADSPWSSGDGRWLVGARRSSVRCSRSLLLQGLCVLVGPDLDPYASAAQERRSHARRAEIVTDEIGSSLRAGFLVLIGGLLVIVCRDCGVLVPARAGRPDRSRRRCPDDGRGPGVVPPPAGPRVPRVAPAFDWFVVGLVASIAVVVPLGLVARHRLRDRLRRRSERSPCRTSSVVRAVGDSIDQIERDPDARRAIIRAYARMEHAFDDAGIPRRPYEAPFEYLGRALRGSAGEPAGRRAPRGAVRARALQPARRSTRRRRTTAIGALREIEQQLKEPPS